MWNVADTDLVAEAARLENVGKTYKASAGRMCAFEINSSRARVTEEMARYQREIDAMKAAQ